VIHSLENFIFLCLFFFCVVFVYTVSIKAQQFMVVSYYMSFNNHGWERWSQNKTCSSKREWCVSFLRNKCSGIKNRRHTKTNSKIDQSINDDKVANILMKKIKKKRLEEREGCDYESITSFKSTFQRHEHNM